MASESERIRQLMDLLEGNTKPMILNEGWLQNLRNKKIKKLGNKERAEMAQRLKGEWLKWLGQTGRQGTMDDMHRFMKMRIGFEDHDIDAVTHASLEPEEAPEAEAAPAEPNEEDGIPLPKDLNAKLSDFGEVGIKVEPKDNKVEPREIVDNPRKYQLANGDWDRKKVSAKLDKMQIGDKLTLGTSTFSRSVGEVPKNESVMEANEDDAEVLSDDVVDAIFDASAARINDEYLLNGPRNDQASAAADAAAAGLGGNRNSGRQPNDRGEMPSGRYDTKEMLAILQSDLNVSRDKLKKITDHVKKNTEEGYAGMQRTDVDVLARIGYALLRART